jgi:hypothetical protein
VPLGLIVKTELDEYSARQAASQAQRTFADAGQRSGQEFSATFNEELAMGVHGQKAADVFAEALQSGITSKLPEVPQV